ncbi:MAG TPA: biotin/lipoyl-containing protein [Candidatus Eisenbacteria bacterium]|nr:biotin/lipoyl-containing protein [Candidatus Eisenbacteria bacterium]
MSAQVKLRTGGHTLAVAVVPDGGGLAATVDGAAHRVGTIVATATASVGHAIVEELVLEVDGQPLRAVVARTRDRIHVAVGGDSFVFERVDDAHGGGAAGAGSGSVVAPMPGKVVKVLVAVGDAVTAGQPLVVVEAMKMETTLAAEIDGTVRALGATPGAMVDAGAVLVELAPAAT